MSYIERVILVGLPNPAVVHATPWCGMYYVAGAPLLADVSPNYSSNGAERGIRGKRDVSP